MPQLNIDCEGPITQNDNAFELCETLIPEGGAFFARVSKYDDYLADVERRTDYKAGDTLKLVLPFLKAFGATQAHMEAFSKRTLVLLPGAREMLRRTTGLLPTFIISTSYQPYLEALCMVTGFPMDQVYCTTVDLDRYDLSLPERERLMELAREVAVQPLLSWPADARGRGALSTEDQGLVRSLDDIFWEEIPAMGIGRLFREVNPIGGQEKATAVEDSLRRTGNAVSEAFYVGDSITDVQALELVSQGRGVALSFNGNRYALRAAQWACLSGNTSIIGAFAQLLVLEGMGGMDALLAGGADTVEGEVLIRALADRGVSEDFIGQLRELSVEQAPRLVRLTHVNLPRLVEESERFRKAIRGVAVGDLG